MGQLTEAIKNLIRSLQISSASPGHINEVLQMDPSIDIDSTLDELKSTGDSKQDKIINDSVKKVERFDKGNVGTVQRFSSAQIGNLQSFVSNPAGFIIQTFIRKFAKGVGIAALAIIIFEAVKFAISEMLKPGRFLDIRFKRDISNEIISFRRREEQQKLKQGFSSIIITTQPGLRGGQKQFVNTLDLVRRGEIPDNIGLAPIISEAAGESFSKAKGKRLFRAGR